MPRLAVLIDWPYHYVPMTYWESLWASDVRREPDAFIIRCSGPNQDIANNAAVQHALDLGADEIMAVSVDQTVPPNFLAQCRSHGVDFVGGLTATRQPGHAWLTFNFNKDEGFVQEDPVRPFQKMDGVGMGCYWCKADVYRKVPPPWYFTTTDPTGQKLVVTSDFNLFANFRKHGIEVWVDSTLVSDHQYEIMLNAQSLGRAVPRMEVIT